MALLGGLVRCAGHHRHRYDGPNVALPHLTEQLGASTSEKLWMVNAYSSLMAGFCQASAPYPKGSY
ncbi:hypothetical protein E0J21_33410 [Rhizobium laguerreae]|nr:hypothetical protein E0J21_33410 [Rhizobium laguerreae]